MPGGFTMGYYQEGTIAAKNIEILTFNPNVEMNITSSEAYDLEAIYQQISSKLSEIEKYGIENSRGHLSFEKDLNLLPRFSEERLELEFRIQSLQKSQGTDNTARLPEYSEITFPIKIENFENALLELGHIDYMNIGRAGRKWVNSDLLSSGINAAESEGQLYHLADASIFKLEELIKEIKAADSADAWLEMVDAFDVKVDTSIKSEIFLNWTNADKSKITTVGQVESWIIDFEKRQNKETVLNTIDLNIAKELNLQ
jgi:hypothetical protein